MLVKWQPVGINHTTIKKLRQEPACTACMYLAKDNPNTFQIIMAISYGHYIFLSCTKKVVQFLPNNLHNMQGFVHHSFYILYWHNGSIAYLKIIANHLLCFNKSIYLLVACLQVGDNLLLASVCLSFTKISKESVEIFQFCFIGRVAQSRQKPIKFWSKSDSRWQTEHNKCTKPPFCHIKVARL